MGPQVMFGSLADGLFEHLEETACYLMFFHLLRFLGDEVIGASVITSFRPTHLYVEHSIVHLFHDALGTREHRRLLVEEGQPQVNVLPFWCLVGDITEDGHDTVAFVLYEIAQDVLLGDGHAVGNA